MELLDSFGITNLILSPDDEPTLLHDMKTGCFAADISNDIIEKKQVDYQQPEHCKKLYKDVTDKNTRAFDVNKIVHSSILILGHFLLDLQSNDNDVTKVMKKVVFETSKPWTQMGSSESILISCTEPNIDCMTGNVTQFKEFYLDKLNKDVQPIFYSTEGDLTCIKNQYV